MKRLYDKALMDQIAKVYGNEVAFLSEFSKALLDIIREGLIRDGQVRLHQFGTFKLKWMQSRKGVNPSTGNKILIQGRPRVIFTPAKRLKDVVEPNPLPRVPWNDVENDSVSQTNLTAPVVALASQKSVHEKPEQETASSDKVVKIVPLSDKPLSSSEPAELVAKLDENNADQQLEADPVTADENDKVEALIDAPEPVVADINDEIKVLEQVAEILKNESVSEQTEKVTAGFSEFHEPEISDKTLKKSDFVPGFKDKKEKVSLPPALEEKDLAWTDQSVVDHIKKLSERHSFNKPEKAEAAKPKFATPEIVVRTDTRSALYETSDAKSDQDLDKELNSVSKLNVETENSNKEEKSRKPWFALAAVAIVLLAVGSLMNVFTGTSNNQPISSQSVVDVELPAATEVVDSVAVSESESESEQELEIVSQVDTVSIEKNTAFQAGTSIVNEEADTEVITEVIDQSDLVEVNKLAEPEQFVADAEVLTEQAVVSQITASEPVRIDALATEFFTARDYRLINGDSLWRLAKKHYVNPFYWPHIYQANQNTINNPDRVKIGKLVLLPTLVGEPDALTSQDKRNIATGYYYNYLYHKKRGNPYAYFSLIGVERFDADLLIQYKDEIAHSDIKNLSLLSD